MNILKPFKSFFRHYLELPQKEVNFVCLGGGTGLSTLLSGLKNYSSNICAIVTMCDEGGSTGRLRRILGVPAVGDLRNCLAALSDTESVMQKLLYYRFTGNRYNHNDSDLGGHNFGNLLLVALSDIYGDFNRGLEEASKILNIRGKVLPSTTQDVHIWAETEDGEKVYGEKEIDLGYYGGTRTIKKLHLKPVNARGFKDALTEIRKAQVICAGPGDLYTSIMPNLLIRDLCHAISQSQAKKILIVNITNKPFETPNYKVSDYIKAFIKHCEQNMFEYILVNNNFTQQIPPNLKYHYVQLDREECEKLGSKIIEVDLVSKNNPLRHDPQKLAQKIVELV